MKGPCDDLLLNDSSVVSGLTASSGRSSSVHGNFRERVLSRDTCCVFCGNTRTSELDAAHIFDVFRTDSVIEKNSTFLFQYGIMNLYDTENGIILCRECHDVFDALLWCVVVEYDASGSAVIYKRRLLNKVSDSQRNGQECSWVGDTHTPRTCFENATKKSNQLASLHTPAEGEKPSTSSKKSQKQMKAPGTAMDKALQ